MFSAVLVMFFIVYGPVLDTFLGPMLDVSFLTCFLLIVSNVIWHQKMRLNRFTLQLSVFPFLIFGICLLNVFLLDIENIEYSTRALMRPVRILVVLFAVAIFARHFVKNFDKNAIEKGVMLLFLVILLHAVIMILQFFDADFRNAIYQFTTAKNVLQNYQETRMAGLAGAGGAQLSIIQSFGLILGVFLFSQSKKMQTKLFVFIGCQLIIASIFLAGRSGLLTAVIFSPLYYLYLNLQQSGYKAVKNTVVTTILLSSVIAVFIVFLFDGLTDNIYFMSAFDRIFDSFISYQDSGKFKVNTLIALSNMFALPVDAMHMLIGKASYLHNNTLYSINTDIGYFRLIWGYGLVGSIFHYSFYIFAIYVIQKLPNISKAEKSVPIVLLLLVLFFNSKEILVFSRMSFQISMFSLFVVYFVSQRVSVKLSAREV